MSALRGPEAAVVGASELARLERRLARERRARAEAETLLDSKSRELYAANEELSRLATSLEQKIGFKTLELLNAQRIARFGTLVWDLANSHITWSEGVYHVLGLDAETDVLSFDRYVACVHPDDRAAFERFVAQSLSGMLELHREYRIEHRVVRPSGEVRWVKAYAEAVSTGQGEIDYMVGAVRDITADKQSVAKAEESRRIIEARVQELEEAQHALAEARDAAQAASRTKTRFLAMMSHEIRTPMNGILGTLHMLEETALDASQARLVGTALASGENLRTILNDILDMSKMEAGRLELEETPFGLVSSIEEACGFWQPMADQKGIRFDVRTADDVPLHVRGDAARIRQILNNFVSNAIKFTGEGGVTVRLCVDRARRSGDGARTPVLLEVQDSGVGIAAEDQSRLFREFSQLGDPGVQGASGTGLGLAISRQLAELMGGCVGVRSAPGAGSCFWLRLPLEACAAPASERHAAVLAPLSEMLGRRPRILLAEDVPTNQMIAEHVLGGFDCSVEVASDGHQVLEALAARPFDLVLMDVSMPKMDGLEATRRIRARADALAGIPIIGVTAYAMAEDLEQFRAVGMDTCVAKPLVREELHAAMAGVLAVVAAEPDAMAESADARAAQPSLVEITVLEDLRRHLSAEQVNMLLDNLHKDFGDFAERSEAALRARDAAALGLAVHGIKGIAGSLGAVALDGLAQRIERALFEERLDDAFAEGRELAPLIAATVERFDTARTEGLWS